MDVGERNALKRQKIQKTNTVHVRMWFGFTQNVNTLETEKCDHIPVRRYKTNASRRTLEWSQHLNSVVTPLANSKYRETHAYSSVERAPRVFFSILFEEKYDFLSTFALCRGQIRWNKQIFKNRIRFSIVCDLIKLKSSPSSCVCCHRFSLCCGSDVKWPKRDTWNWLSKLVKVITNRDYRVDKNN